eukprot:6463629-Lingulodinium_polyedra.AAC.1
MCDRRLVCNRRVLFRCLHQHVSGELRPRMLGFAQHPTIIAAHVLAMSHAGGSSRRLRRLRYAVHEVYFRTDLESQFDDKKDAENKNRKRKRDDTVVRKCTPTAELVRYKSLFDHFRSVLQPQRLYSLPAPSASRGDGQQGP